MQGAGMESWFVQERLAVRGLVEVLKHIPEIAGIRRQLFRRLLAVRPAVVIGIDAPDFNLGLEAKLRRRGLVTIQCVSPTIWAWRPGRIKGIRRAVTHMLVLFPFEEPLYRDAGVPVSFIGHPLADELAERITRVGAREELRITADASVVAMLPGSRHSEIELMAPPFIEAAKQIAALRPDVRLLVPFATRETRQRFEEALYAHQALELPMTLLYGHAHEAMAAADVVLAASGTATLEAALVGTPVVIAYRLKPLSHWITRRLLRTRFIGLPNILAGEALCPEFLQDDATPENLAQATLNLLGDKQVAAALAARFGALRDQLARGAAARAAEAVAPYIDRAHASSPKPA
jgi:lipid-A-disaccharide synthase